MQKKNFRRSPIASTAIGHECILERQQIENDRVNAEAQQLKQIERHVAQENQEHNQKTRFFWNDESTRQLLEMMRELQMDFLKMDGTKAGFIPWARFFKKHENHETNFSLLRNLSFETLEYCYKALITVYKVSRVSYGIHAGANAVHMVDSQGFV
ncbi:hypothetical protein O181_082002 [Austropuccinia psidii MF-1]|uniref:Uncharacterized protein n=1 Tax=Austropuccinia psidii MF-1 TaxID=1389203 RepID=A0A9Q3FPM3_9BASI|nr:hypothetical protein [Austropuccinia psidii MF-1]